MRFHSAVPIGSGGTGRVLRAFDPQLGHEIALKLLQHPSPELALRMQREARAQARIEHPHVVRIYDSGEADGQPYIAMQLIEGVPLDAAAAALDLRERIALLLPVIDAVAAAHRLGLIHRDLKPSNILVERQVDGRLKAYVLDFGLVADHAGQALTAPGEVLGTPGYLSPEQASSGAPVDARSDVFSLGVILYQLCCQRLPFAAEGVAACIAQILHHQAVPVHRIDPQVPLPLSRIVQQCLEKEPAARYRSARALYLDLQRFLAGEAVHARRYGPSWRVRRWLRASPARIWALLLALLLPLVAAGLLLQQQLAQVRMIERAQRFTATALDIESRMQLTSLWPQQDLALQRQRLRPQLQDLEQAWRSDQPTLRAVAAEPLARALEALGERESLLQLLSAAQRDGIDTAALAARHGRALQAEYVDAQARLSAIADSELRQFTAQQIEQRWLQPALARLQQAAGSGSDSDSDSDDPQLLLARALLSQHKGDTAGALQLLATLPAPAPQAQLLAAQWQLQGVLKLLDQGDPAVLASAQDQALQAYVALSEAARSLPQAWAGRCQLLIVQLRSLSRSGSETDTALPGMLEPCEAAVRHDSADGRLWSLRAQAYSALARRALMLGQSPLPALEQLRSGSAHELDINAALAHAQTLLSVSEHLRRSAADAEAPLLEAIALLQSASQAAPADSELLLTLASARQLLAIHGPTDQQEAGFAQAVSTLEQALAVQELLSTRLRLAEVLTWWGNARYHQLQDPGDTLPRAISVLETSRAELPSDLRILQRLAFARWTAGQYHAAVGAAAQPDLQEAEALYDQVLQLDPLRSSARFNRLSVQYTLARHLLQRGDSAGVVLERVRAGFPELLDERVADDLRVQQAARVLLEVRQQAHERGADAMRSADYEAARQLLLRAMDLPRDRAAAAMQLADLWVHRPPAAADRALLDADLARIDAVAAQADAPRLLQLHLARLLHRAARSDPQRYGERASAQYRVFANSPFLRPYAAEFD